jgi:predicted nucleotidyltransferase
VHELAARLGGIPGVVAVTLGGSRATGTAREDSDSDLGLYYRGDIRADDVRALGYGGTVVEPGEWGRILNGGARLVIDGRRVELLYRSLEVVEHWRAEAEAGRFEIDHLEGRVVGLPTYVLVGELATCEVLRGELPRPGFPEELRRSAPPHWRSLVASNLDIATAAADRGDVVMCVGLLAQAVIAEAHARLAELGEWELSEKGIARRAGLGAKVTSTLAAAGDRPFELGRSVSAMRVALGTRGRSS